MPQVSEVHVADVGAVVRKRASGAEAASLRVEAERLRAAAHPGVVELLGSEGDGTEWQLTLAYGGRSLEATGPLPVRTVAGVVAAVATTLADLHEAGVVHGRIDGSHVLIGPRGRPLLCGWGGGTHPTDPADDVAALGTLLAGLLGGGEELEPIPDRRWWPRRSWSGWERRSLLLLADQACAEPPTRRPTARRLAAAIAEGIPDAAVSEPAVSEPAVGEPAVGADPIEVLRAGASSHDGSRETRWPALAAALAGVVLMGAGLIGMVSGARTSGGGVASPVADPPAVSPALSPTTAPTAPAEPVTIDGTIVQVGDRRYAIGLPGDVIAVADWDCDGQATPALLRPDSGEVFVFGRWATDADVVAVPVARVAGAVTLIAEVDSTGCPTPVVGRPDGSAVPVPLEPQS